LAAAGPFNPGWGFSIANQITLHRFSFLFVLNNCRM